MNLISLLVSFCILSIEKHSFVNGFEKTRLTSTEFGKTYILRTGYPYLNFTTATKFCTDEGGHLAKIESRKEWLWIKNQGVDTMSVDFWIGATPVGGGQTVTHWLDGSKIENYLWQLSSDKFWSGLCNALRIITENNEPKFGQYLCSS